jgi:hypothetical protein
LRGSPIRLRAPSALCFALPFQFEPCILMRLGPGERRDHPHEIKDAFRLAIFFTQNGFDDFRGLGLGDVDSRLA